MKFAIKYSKKTNIEMSKHKPSFEIDDGGSGGVDVVKGDNDGFYGDNKSTFFMIEEENSNSGRGATSRLLKTKGFSKSKDSLSTDQAGSASPSHLSSFNNRYFSETNIDMLGLQRAGSVRRPKSPKSPRLPSRQSSHDGDIDG